MRILIPLLAVLAAAACGASEPEPPAEPDQTSSVEARLEAPRVARERVEAAQRQAQARLDSQMQAVMDTTAP